jgi:hypothetical protein
MRPGDPLWQGFLRNMLNEHLPQDNTNFEKLATDMRYEMGRILQQQSLYILDNAALRQELGTHSIACPVGNDRRTGTPHHPPTDDDHANKCHRTMINTTTSEVRDILRTLCRGKGKMDGAAKEIWRFRMSKSWLRQEVSRGQLMAILELALANIGRDEYLYTSQSGPGRDSSCLLDREHRRTAKETNAPRQGYTRKQQQPSHKPVGANPRRQARQQPQAKPTSPSLHYGPAKRQNAHVQ